MKLWEYSGKNVRITLKDGKVFEGIAYDYTSALDNETEKAVMAAIDRLAGNKTLIIIAHRLTTITNCDVIYEVKNKQINEVILKSEKS